jgi:hypothetical protein
MFNSKIVKNFIAKEDCEYLINSVKDIDVWESGGSFWDNRVLNINSIYSIDKKSAKILIDAVEKAQKSIKNLYDLDYDVYTDIIQVVRWFPGMEQPLHSDDMLEAGIEGFGHRLYGSIIYLNDNFKGGHTFYKNDSISPTRIIPETGKFAVHPGDAEHLHGVSKVSEAIRYTVATFWTKEKERAFDYSLYK